MRGCSRFLLIVAILTFGTAGWVKAQPAAPAAAVAGFVPFEGAVDAAAISAADLGKELAISGTVLKIELSTGDRVPYRLTLLERDPNPVMVVYWPDLAPTIHGAKSAPAAGTKVSAKGRLVDYRGVLQLRIQDVATIRIEGYAPTAAVAGMSVAAPQPPSPGPAASGPLPSPDADGYYSMKDVPALRVAFGSAISIRGTVAGFRPASSDRAPSSVSLAEGAVELDVVYWNAAKAPVPDFSKPGTPIFATGKLGMYRESMQLDVDDLENMSTTPLDKKRVAGKPAPAMVIPAGAKATDGWPGTKKEMDRAYLNGLPSSVKAAERAPLNRIGKFEAGTEVIAVGKITSVRFGTEGGFVDIADGTGAMTILVSEATANELVYGSEVEASGLLEWDARRAQTVLKATTIKRKI